MKCEHKQFMADVVANRLEDSGSFFADIRIRCVECNEPFRFIGAPPGIDPGQPTCSIDGLELHAPIEPELVKMLHSGASFIVPQPKMAG